MLFKYGSGVTWVLGCSLLACSGERTFDVEMVRDPLINCGTELGVAPLENACGHGWVGPFGDSMGLGAPGSPIQATMPPAAAPEVSEVQVTYSLTLASTGGTYGGALTFVPPFTQDYALVLDVGAALQVLDDTDALVLPILQQDIGAACAQVGDSLGAGAPGTNMASVDVVPLEAGRTYRLVLGSAAVPDVRLLIDEPNDFLNLYFADVDGDLFGDPFSPLVSECVAPDGYVARAGDCDDGNELVNPDAEEVLDDGVDIDNDCDTLIFGEGATSDLEVVSVNVAGGVSRLAVGSSTSVIVQQVITNNSSIPTDALVTRSASSTGGTIVPATSLEFLNNVELGEYRRLATSYEIACTEAGNATFTVSVNVSPARSIDVDPNPDNDTREVTFVVQCLPCVHAAEDLVLADDTLIEAKLVMAGSYFELGANGARVAGDVKVAGTAYLRNTSVVDGDLTYATQLIHQGAGTYQVTGVTAQAPVSVPAIQVESVAFGTNDVSAPSGSSQTWAPGSYGSGEVSGSVTLSAGSYSFRSLVLAPDARLWLDTSRGDVLIGIDEAFEVGDRAWIRRDGAGLASIYTNDDDDVRIGTDVEHFDATLIAPHASVHVYSRTEIRGCLAAKDIAFEPQVELFETPFPGGTVTPVDPVDPDPPTCSDGVQNGQETGVDCGGPACPSCAPPCALTSYDAQTQMAHSTGGPSGLDWNIWSNGNVSTLHTFTAGPTRISVLARGQAALGIPAHMVIRVGGQIVGQTFVPSASNQWYDFYFQSTPGQKLVEIAFDNDLYAPPADRNLYVRTLSIDCQTPPPSAPVLSATFHKTNDWGSGYCVDLRVTNTGTASTMTWQALIDTRQSQIYTSWNGNFMGATGIVQVSPVSWNRIIAPGQTISSVGFCANRIPGTNNNPTITAITGY